MFVGGWRWGGRFSVRTIDRRVMGKTAGHRRGVCSAAPRVYPAASMQPQLLLYIASVAGAVSLFLLMPTPRKGLRVWGGLLGAATLGLLWLILAPLTLADPEAGLPHLDTGFSDGQTPFYYLFSAIAIAAAVRVITHHRPVYAALWFVMVVIASAGLLLTLSAEFMAFAMLIIYGGAILVTYMFVIMLATPPRSHDESDAGPDYDRFSVEPIWACVAGFLLLAVILSVSFRPMTHFPVLVGEHTVPAAGDRPDAEVLTNVLAGRGAELSLLSTPQGGPAEKVVNSGEPSRRTLTDATTGRGEFADAELYLRSDETATLPPPTLSNVERVGLDLFKAHPLAIELAGVILLLALIGAVVIAKTQVLHLDEPLAEGGAPAVESGPLSVDAAEGAV